MMTPDNISYRPTDWLNAIYNKDLSLVACMLEYGFDINSLLLKSNGEGSTALIEAILTPDSADIVDYLLQKKADPNLCAPISGLTPLMACVMTDQLAIFDALILYGADITQSDANNQSALMIAAQYGSAACVEKILNLLTTHPQRLNHIDAISTCGHTALFSAVLHKKVDIAQRLIDAGANPVICDLKGTYLVLQATMNNDADMLQILFNSPALLMQNAVNYAQWNAVLYATEKNYYESLALLIEYKADLNIIDQYDNNLLMIALQSGSIACATLLLHAGVPTRTVNNNGEEALLLALKTNNLELINSFLSIDHDIDRHLSCGHTPLSYSLIACRPEITEALIVTHKADINKRTRPGHEPILVGFEGLHQLLTRRKKQFLDQEGFFDHVQSQAEFQKFCDNLCHIIRHTDFDFSTQQHLLVDYAYDSLYYGFEGIIRALHHRGYDCNTAKSQGRTLLMCAAAHKKLSRIFDFLLEEAKVDVNTVKPKTQSNALMWAIQAKNETAIYRLIPLTTDLDLQDINGYTALMLSVCYQMYHVAELLIQKGAQVNLTTAKSETALRMAVFPQNEKIIPILLQSGAQMNTLDSKGHSPLMAAAQSSKEIVAGFIRSYQSCLLAQNSSQAACESSSLAPLTEIINFSNQHGKTALFMAIYKNKEDVVRFLLEHGANVNQSDQKNDTPMMIAIALGYEKIVDLLWDFGADPTVEHAEHGNYVGIAATYGRLSILKKFVQQKVPFDLLSTKGLTPLYQAAINGHEAIVEFLVRFRVRIQYIIPGSQQKIDLIKSTCLEGRANCLKLILEKSHPRENRTLNPILLRAAVEKGHIDIVRYLMQDYPSVLSYKDQNLFDILYVAAYSCPKASQLLMVQTILDIAPASFDVVSRSMALIAACKVDNLDVAQFLLNLETNPAQLFYRSRQNNKEIFAFAAATASKSARIMEYLYHQYQHTIEMIYPNMLMILFEQSLSPEESYDRAEIFIAINFDYSQKKNCYNNDIADILDDKLEELQLFWCENNIQALRFFQNNTDTAHSLKKLLQRYASENLTQREHISLLRKNVRAMIDFLEKSPHLIEIFDHISSIYLTACVNQPIWGFLEITSWLYVAQQDSFEDKINALSFDYLMEKIKVFVEDCPHVGAGLKVEAANLLLIECSKRLSKESEQYQWPHIPSFIPYDSALSLSFKALLPEQAVILVNEILDLRVQTLYDYVMQSYGQLYEIFGAIVLKDEFHEIKNNLEAVIADYKKVYLLKTEYADLFEKKLEESTEDDHKMDVDEPCSEPLDEQEYTAENIVLYQKYRKYSAEDILAMLKNAECSQHQMLYDAIESTISEQYQNNVMSCPINLLFSLPEIKTEDQPLPIFNP